MSDIHEAAENGDLSSVQEILERDKSKLEEQYPDVGDRPIHSATSQGHLKVVEFLLEAGADINARGHLGRTALYQAVHGQDAEMVKLLLKHGADPGIAEDNGFTPLHFATATEDESIAKLLRGRDSDG